MRKIIKLSQVIKKIYKAQLLLSIKNSKQTKNSGNFLNLINNIYQNPTDNITLNSGKLNAIIIISG